MSKNSLTRLIFFTRYSNIDTFFMIDKYETGLAIFKQICDVNDLDPDKIKEIAQKKQPDSQNKIEEVEHLIRTVFDYKAKTLTRKLELGSTSESEHIRDGEEYSIGADPDTPSFTINEEFIHSKYSEDEAKRLIEALGQVMLPIRA